MFPLFPQRREEKRRKTPVLVGNSTSVGTPFLSFLLCSQPLFITNSMNPPYLEATVIFLVVVYVFETYLDYRQHLKFLVKERPKSIECMCCCAFCSEFHFCSFRTSRGCVFSDLCLALVSETSFLKSQAYGLDKSQFGFLASFLSTLKEFISLRSVLMEIF